MSWTVAGVARRWAHERPDQPALTFEGTTRTWSELHRRTSQAANGLRAHDVGAQDRVAILDKNTPAHFELLFGSAAINAVYVAVNWRLAPAEIAQIVNDAEAKLFVVGAEFVPQLEAIADQLTTVRTILIAEGTHAKFASWEEWLGAQSHDDPGSSADAPEVAVQLYTSGTTGLPKGVMLTSSNFEAAMSAGVDEFGLRSDAVSLVTMPLFHIGGTGWALFGMTNGCHTVLQREVNPVAILEAIDRYKVTHAFLVPAVLMFLLLTPGIEHTDFSSVECIVYGASPISEDVLVKCLEVMKCQFAQVYGLTETTGAITVLRSEQHDPSGPNRGRLRSCGIPLAGVEVRVTSPEDGSTCPPGVVGELSFRTPQNMLGYWKKPAETASALIDGGWLRTGDAGYVDEDGYLFLHDRIKDMIVSGGENIYPAEVENALMSHAGVADVAVIGVPSERWGETVKAMVVRTPGSDAAPDDLIEHCRERLARYKCPTSVDFLDALPRNPSGKILKRELREPFWAGRERRVN